MKLLEKVYSKTDKTIKFIFLTEDDLVVELSYINKDEGKDIICVPSQTSCNITDVVDKLINRNICSNELVEAVNFVYEDLELAKNKKVLLISYMGCGEPILNYKNITENMVELREIYQDKRVPLIKFAISTSLPSFTQLNYFKMVGIIYKEKLPVKIHLSLHYTFFLYKKRVDAKLIRNITFNRV